jgi:hypothetical protein
MYDLDYKLAKKIIKPLKKFRESKPISYPANLNSLKEWYKILDKMIYAFESFISDDSPADFKRFLKTAQKQQEGFELFGKYFMDLWE